MECNLTTQPEHFAITPEIIVKKRKGKIASTNYDKKRKPKLVNNRGTTPLVIVAYLLMHSYAPFQCQILITQVVVHC